MFAFPIHVDVSRAASNRSRATYFSSLDTFMPSFTRYPKRGGCYTQNHTSHYYKPNSNYGYVGSSTIASAAMRRR